MFLTTAIEQLDQSQPTQKFEQYVSSLNLTDNHYIRNANLSYKTIMLIYM